MLDEIIGSTTQDCQMFVQCLYSDPMSTDVGALRIGEFARRVGVAPELLRAWEQRYGLLQPLRSGGGFRLYTTHDADRVARLLPFLRDVGEEWTRGELEIGQEHFATTMIRERLLSLARFWGRGGGPLAILACPPGERHDVGLIAFGLVLRSHGWRILFLGAETPMPTLASAVETTSPRLVVVASMDESLLEAEGAALRRLTRSARLILSGAGATEELAARLRLERVDGDLVAAAETVPQA